MEMTGTTRRNLLIGMAGLAASSGKAVAAPPFPQSPVSLNIVDAGGTFQMLQAGFEQYRKDHPQLISRIAYSAAPPPQLPGKIKAQQAAGGLDIDVVLGSNDTASPGMEQNLWLPILPDYASSLPDLEAIYQPGAWAMQQLVQGQGVCLVYEPGGPLLQYMPDRVKQPPVTPQELLDWTRVNPKRFLYARPANSGPGRCFVQGLAYLLGDKDPKDPKNGWDKTWDYLRELGKNIGYYGPGTVATLQALAEGSCDVIASQTGWDLNSRALGVVPLEAEISVFKNFHWIAEANYLMVPRGIAQEKLAVVLDLVRYLLTPAAQAFTYDSGYFYPGPAVKDVPITMAPQQSRDLLQGLIRPTLANLFTSVPIETPVSSRMMVELFARWDEMIGANVGQ